MTLQLRIEHANGTTNTLDIVGSDDLGDDALPSLASVTKTRSIIREPDGTDTAEVRVYRDAWNEVRNDLDNIDDKFFVEESGTDIFGGRLHDWEFSDITVSLILHGPKEDALGATPSSGAEVYQPQGDDSLVTNELLSRVGTVSAGTVTQQNGSIAFEESHSSPGKSITKLAETTGSETVYRPDFSLDYVDSLGSDRTATVLSPANQNVLGSPRIQRREQEDFTHIRVLGSQNGSTQFQAERVINSNTTREKWGLFTEKDAQSQSRVDALADEIQSELQSSDRHIEVEMEIAGSVAPELGDEFSVTLSEYGVDTTLRALRVSRTLDGDGDRYSCLFSNRRLARELQGERQARSTDSFDSGNPGQYYALADGEGWDALNSNESYEFSVYRPTNTIAEYRAKLQLESREYRLRASQSGHDHSLTISDHNHDVSISDTSTSTNNADFGQQTGFFRENGITVDTTETISLGTVSQNGSAFLVDVNLAIANGGGGVEISLERNGNRVDSVTDSYVGDDSSVSCVLTDFSNPNGDSYDVVVTDFGVGTTTTFSYQINGDIIEQHTHDVSISDTSTTTDGGGTTTTTDNVAAVDPGINTITGVTVSNVAVDIGGTTVASGLSHSDLSGGRTIDISGVLADGSNPVAISSDSLGEIRATIEYEGLKNASQ
jgi:hypothetical protein